MTNKFQGCVEEDLALCNLALASNPPPSNQAVLEGRAIGYRALLKAGPNLDIIRPLKAMIQDELNSTNETVRALILVSEIEVYTAYILYLEMTAA